MSIQGTTTPLSLAQQISIRDAGFDEYWLQDQIYQNPNCLGLGELEAIAKEKKQSSGGRLDILLKNPEDESMYEVEVMLGETDESHIIRTIEYWDNEKRKYPLRQHFAVLVAEHVNRRYFNVIHLLSHSIPIIAIQAALLESNLGKSLFFNTMLDTYEEIDDNSSTGSITFRRADWEKKSKWTVQTADTLFETIASTFSNAELNYLQSYIAISVASNNYFWFYKRTQPKSVLGFYVYPGLQEEVTALLDAKQISYTRKPRFLTLIVDEEMIKAEADLFREIATIVKRHWTS